MNTDLPDQQPPIIQDSVPSPESSTPVAPPVQEAVVMQATSPSHKNSFMNLMIIVLVLVIILLIGFFVYTKINGSKNTNSPIDTNTQLPSPTIIISPTLVVTPTVEPTLSASDEIESLQNDINATDLTSMDQDVQQIDQNLQGL